MTETWKQTSCCLCFVNCGLKVQVEENRIVKVLPDKSNPRSEGHICAKGRNINAHQRHAGRLTKPLKRVGDDFVEISWETALAEIAERLRAIVDEHGPRSYAYMGGGGQGTHFEAAFGVAFMRALGSRYHFSAIAQEHSGRHWVQGRTVGRQPMNFIAHVEEADMLLGIGWNGMESHGIPRAPYILKQFSKDPDKLLVIVDPRRSRTAEKADIHLALEPGTDALLLRAMIAIILQEGWQHDDYLAAHVSGLEGIRDELESFDIAAGLEICGLDYETVKTVCRELTRRKACLHDDLGMLMNRNSTLSSWLVVILMALAGRLCLPGGNVLPGRVSFLGSHTDERSDKTWRGTESDFPAVMGVFPPNALPEEITSEKPDRIRALVVSASNPLLSFADTTAYEEAFAKLDLLVTVELAMSETARLSDYVLPARSSYESYDGTFFALSYPEVYFQMRQPVIEAAGETLETAEVFIRLAEATGLVPEIPPELHDAAQAGPSPEFRAALGAYLEENPRAAPFTAFIVARTLGRVLGSVNLAALYALLMSKPKSFWQNAARAGFEPGPDAVERLFQALLDNPQGLWIGKCDADDNFASLATPDGRLNLEIPELEAELAALTPAAELAELEPDPDYPLILMAGHHMAYNANSLLRDPSWIRANRYCTLQMHPDDVSGRGLSDGQTVTVTTAAGSVQIELEETDSARAGHVVMPHGFGMVNEDGVNGVNVNRLTSSRHRDPRVGTPYHRYVPCQVTG